MLRPEQLTSSARRVFEHLAQEEALRGFTLIGGTALALQIGHRRSEDLDFWLPGESLDKGVISALIRRAQNAGLPAMLATPHQRIVAARINGFDLLSRAQDYVIAGVKVTFFARHDVAYRYFDAEPRLREEGISFAIMSEAGLFAMKAHVLHERVRSRDLYDLKTLLVRGRTLEELLRTAQAADPACSPEYTKSVLIGDVPLDKGDEGFESIGVTESVQTLQAFFRNAVDELEQSIAEHIASPT